MRNIVVHEQVSADGFFAATDGATDWAARDPEVWRAFLDGARFELLLGRRTHELAAWPDELRDAPRFVVSRTAQGPRVLRNFDPRSVRELLHEPGPDLLVLGSASIVRQLAQWELIDEIAFAISPTLLGGGRTLLDDVPRRTPLLLVEARPFASGCLLVRYARR